MADENHLHHEEVKFGDVSLLSSAVGGVLGLLLAIPVAACGKIVREEC